MGSFISDILGAPWKKHTCGPTEFDCFGLCYYVTRELLGVELPCVTAGGSVRDLHKHFDRLEDGAPLSPMDWAYTKYGNELHVGLVENHTFYVEATKEFGVMRRRLETLDNPEFYRLRDA